MGGRACLLGGLIALAFVELPIMVRAMDEALGMVPKARKEAAYAFFYMGELVEHGPAQQVFSEPKEERTKAFLTGVIG